VYTLFVTDQFEDQDVGYVPIDRSRFLEYTEGYITHQLSSLSLDALACIRSWPCLVMREGRSDEHAYVAEIRQIRHESNEIRLALDLIPNNRQIVNDALWKLRESLDIEKFEFNRNHWAVKETDLFDALAVGGFGFEPETIARFKLLPLPTPARAELLRLKGRVAQWGHTAIDNFLLEAGVDGPSHAE